MGLSSTAQAWRRRRKLILRHCEERATKQSSIDLALDCFAALAMTR
jgi:hypothetical protein